MFRVFKAGGAGVHGSGNLRFLRQLFCHCESDFDCEEYHWLLEVAFERPGRCDEEEEEEEADIPVDFGDESSITIDQENTVWHDWDSVYEWVENELHQEGLPCSTMEHESVHRFITTIVMIARECPDVSKEINFRMEGEPEPELEDLGW
ncbi:hypothetical protein N8I77_002914 [Diaporthe amygdali]|uniref:Uncharacterized protein n=1 Tax=Phomopsis amygdali TaxID=1214568 RepID=A0AAD9SKA1_PHOAM|nr:hypothetical protein N8I77_002914 [Diaporthe amygdali]